MPQTVPKFVRLSDYASAGCQVDINTGWGISGRDVRSVPDDPNVQQYVRNGLNRGLFEEASQAEYDEVHEGDILLEDITKVIMIDPSQPMSENLLRLMQSQQSAPIDERFASRREASLRVTEDTPPDAYVRLSEQALRAELSSRGMDSSGDKAALIAKLNAADGVRSAPVDESDTESDDDDYNSWTVPALRAEAEDRGLSKSGSKSDLVARLEANDEEGGGDAEDGD